MAKRLIETDLEDVNELYALHRKSVKPLHRLDLYYNLEQIVQHIGMAVQPELRAFTTILGICPMVVDEPVLRQNVQGFYRQGNTINEDENLRNAYVANNLESNLPILLTEEKIFGRAYMSVSANPDDEDHPLMTVESPLSLFTEVRNGMIKRALRVYTNDRNQATALTLYTPKATKHILRDMKNGAWVYNEEDMEDPIDEHELGIVPIIGFVHRRRAGEWNGRSEMEKAVSKTDTTARIITNMSVSSDSLALPHRWAAGVKRDGFIDKNGRTLPIVEAYMTALMTSEDPKARFGNFEAAQLANFHNAVDSILSWVAAEYGYPLRFFGQNSVNPAAEGAIVADESRFITRVEHMNKSDGDSLAWAMDLYEHIRTSKPAKDKNAIRVLWKNPATPTLAQTVDAGTKLLQVGALSIDGFWDLVGWDESRKKQERERLELQNRDPLLAQVMDRALNTQQPTQPTAQQPTNPDQTVANDAATVGQ